MRSASRLGSREASHDKMLAHMGRIRISEISKISEISGGVTWMFCV